MNIADLLGMQEDLDPELQFHLYDDPTFGKTLKHPLVFSIVHTPQMNAMVNRQLQAKKDALARAEAKEDWETWVWLHERPYRLDALIDVSDKLYARNVWHGEQFWRLAGQVWTDSENIWQNLDEWRDLFESGPWQGDMKHFMTPDDFDALWKPPSKGGINQQFLVYRGFRLDEAVDGLSWTLDREQAVWFARRLAQPGDVPRVASGSVSKRDVIGYMTGRGESEIVVLPENVCGIEVEKVGE